MSDRFEDKDVAGLLGYYSRQVSAHVTPVISIFFSIIGLLILIRTANTLLSRAFFSLLYFLLGALGAYFYGRLFYFGKLVDEALVHPSFASLHTQLRERVVRKSVVLRIVVTVSETKEKGYRLFWAWLMFLFTGLLALISWAIVFFQL
jgi:hypothetical protein